jgi:rhamnose utilization protein RhaD (predicted bifunctional aldolase and dehydrogenase)/NAD(P)-dependent dehydrogenase (short-subunit alcohol dehydrogenase family)
MENLWDQKEANNCNSDLDLRVYSSRILGKNSDLVLHGGGNTSVKGQEKTIYNENIEVLYVKGSGWDLETIEREGFSPCDLNSVVKLVTLEKMSDSEMVNELRKSLLNPKSPNPSVEAILHAVIPYKFVDHTHADAVVALSNTPDGEKLIKRLYGERSLILDYKMPGFILSKQVFEATKDIDWNEIDSIILLHHGVFTFSNDAQKSYDKMIEIATLAEKFIEENSLSKNEDDSTHECIEPLDIAKLRKKCSKLFEAPMLIQYKNKYNDFLFSLLDIENIATRGPVTPDHVISTKRIPLILEDDLIKSVDSYVEDYKKYFERNKKENQICLDPVPRWAISKGKGSLIIGPDPKRLHVISDIVDHTQKCIQWSENLSIESKWTALPEEDIFDLEYWELEQAKLKVGKKNKKYNGKVAIVTGAASGIGKACAENLIESGCSVIAVDINPKITSLFSNDFSIGIECDLSNTMMINEMLKKAIYKFGGIDFLVSNAGSFPKSTLIEETTDDDWESTININLNSHFKVLRTTIPYLKCGIDPAVVFIGSKNVPAPGPGVASYSVSKSGLAQLARVAALELGEHGIRVNTVHPNAVFDTGIWTEEVISNRAEKYKLTVEEYKKNNVLHTTIVSKDVAQLVDSLLCDKSSKTTGAQIPIDGGNDRVI